MVRPNGARRPSIARCGKPSAQARDGPEQLVHGPALRNVPQKGLDAQPLQVGEVLVLAPALDQGGLVHARVGGEAIQDLGKDCDAGALQAAPVLGELGGPRGQLRVVQEQGDRLCDPTGPSRATGLGGAAPPTLAAPLGTPGDSDDGGESLLQHVAIDAGRNLRNQWLREARETRAAIHRDPVLHLLGEPLEQELGERLGALDPMLEGRLTLRSHQGVRVLPLGQEEEAQGVVTGGKRQGGLQGLPGGLPPSPVPVEAEDKLRGRAQQELQVLRGGGGAQGGHRIVDPELGQGDHVHVALHHQEPRPLAPGLLGLVEAIELPPLVEDRGLGRVQVLGLAVPQHAPAEADDPAATVADGEDDALAQAIVALAILVCDEPRLKKPLPSGGIASQVREQEVPAGGGIAQPIASGDLPGEPSALEVLHRPRRLGMGT